MKGKYGENSNTYAFRVKGQFPKSENDSLIHKSWIDDAEERGEDATLERAEKSPRYMGVDIAYDGPDWSAIVVRRGPEIEHVEMWQGHDPVESSHRISQVYKDFKASGMPIRAIFVDDTGVGAGVTATLRQTLGLPAIPVRVGEAAVDDGGTKCALKRDWLWWQCRVFFQRMRPRFLMREGEALVRLKRELIMPHYSHARQGVVVEPKAKMKVRLKTSPDVADALCLTFARDGCKFYGNKTAGELRQDQKLRRKRYKKKGFGGSERWKIC
jgi:hypothetical protein